MSASNERRTKCRLINSVNSGENNHACKHSLIVDISSTGAGLITRKKLEQISGKICLNILQPELSSLNGFIIDAEVIWVDEDYDKDFRKMGVRFSNVDKGLKNDISELIDWFSDKDHHFLRCKVAQG